jgi:2-polyprenyl-3-methyl-5-hydroxy-6-metoxy-1,4-benzoquinol methylase
MTILDKLIQRLRIAKAVKYITPGSSVLDVGCHQGELFSVLGKRLGSGVGIDPLLQQEVYNERFSLIRGHFPGDLNGGGAKGGDLNEAGSFDHICLLAVLEHIPMSQQQEIAVRCRQLLRHDGRVIITVPSPGADILLDILKKLRLIKGMSLEDHYGFDPNQIPVVFSQAGFTLVVHKRFQAGLNNVFVLKK